MSAPRVSAARRGAAALALLCAAAFLVRLGLSLRAAPVVDSWDGQQYARLAQGLLHGAGYLNAKGRPSAYWPPGYPALMACAAASGAPFAIAVRFVQALLGATTVACVYALARRLGDARAALLAAAVAAFYPLHVYAATTFFPATLLTAQLAALLLFAHVSAGRRSVAAAAAAGLAGAWMLLTAGTALPAVLLAAAYLAWPAAPAPVARARAAGGLRLAAALLLPVALVAGLWTARNTRAFGVPVLVSTNAGYNAWLGNYPGVRPETGNAHFSDAMDAEADSVWALPGNEATRDRVFWRLARAHAAEDRARWAALTAGKARLFWSVVPEPPTHAAARSRLEAPASWLSYGLLLPFAAYALARALRRDRFAWFALLLALAYTAEHALTLAKVRFRLPLDTLVIAYGAAGLVAAWDALRQRGRADARGR